MAKIKVRVAFAEDHHLDVPEKVTSHNILRSVDLTPKEDILIVRLSPHEEQRLCRCFGCELSKQDRSAEWFHKWIRFDIMQKNAQLKLQDGDRLLAVRNEDCNKWTSSLRNVGFPVGPEDLFRFAAPQSLPHKRNVYLFGEDYEVFNLEKFLNG